MAIGDIDARHLVSRTGLGTPPAEIARLAKLTRAKAADTLLAETRKRHRTKLPDWAGERIRPREALMQSMGDQERVQKMLRERGVDLKLWWFGEMVAAKSPLTERMTLFWHNHFTSSLRKVKRPKLLLKQNQMLRKHALGSFETMLRETLRDPAMLVYLDNIRNNAQKPNENLGRELLELFTLGEGQYGEPDVKAAARALTGRTVNRRNGEFRDATWKHDDGPKTFLGKTGRFDADGLVDVILDHPACARLIAEKVRGEFVTTPASRTEVDRLARAFRKKDWSIKALVREVLLSGDFWAAANRATRIKSPVELIVGTVRTLRLDVPNRRVFVKASRALGQDLLDPPNVKGWAGGEAWITSNTLLRRVTMMDQAGRFETKIQNLNGWLGKAFSGGSEAQRLQKVLLAVPPLQPIRATDIRERVIALLTDPTYQLG